MPQTAIQDAPNPSGVHFETEKITHYKKTTFSFQIISDIVAAIDIFSTFLIGIALVFANSLHLIGLGGYMPPDGGGAQINHYAPLILLISILFGYLIRLTKQQTFPMLSRSLPEVIFATIGLWCLTLLFALALLYLAKLSEEYARSWLILYFITNAIWIAVLRPIELSGLRAAMRSGRLRRRRIAIIGATDQASCLIEKLSETGVADLFEIVGIFDDRKTGDRTKSTLHGIAVLGPVSYFINRSAPELISADIIAIALPHNARNRILQVKSQVQAVPADVVLAPDLVYSIADPKQGNIVIGSVPLIKLSQNPLKDWKGVCKWLEDKLIACGGIVITAPLMLIIAFLIKMNSPGPVIFRQTRFGFNNRPITVYKFRTMYQDLGDESGSQHTVRGDIRVTPVGYILRRFSLDELPQLFNVLFGDMSIVGPRAHPVKMKVLNSLYHEAVHDYTARHRVKPGITGLAQVSGSRGEIQTVGQAKERVALDLYYIEHYSIWLDLAIILRTFVVSFWSRNAY